MPAPLQAFLVRLPHQRPERRLEVVGLLRCIEEVRSRRWHRVRRTGPRRQGPEREGPACPEAGEDVTRRRPGHADRAGAVRPQGEKPVRRRDIDEADPPAADRRADLRLPVGRRPAAVVPPAGPARARQSSPPVPGRARLGYCPGIADPRKGPQALIATRPGHRGWGTLAWWTPMWW